MEDTTTNLELNKKISDLNIAQIKIDLLLNSGKSIENDITYYESLVSDFKISLNTILELTNKNE
tara:strand:+ start:18310 stop:18501 length:192 start_codon:yes stop_codon:yes gene_type:complete